MIDFGLNSLLRPVLFSNFVSSIGSMQVTCSWGVTKFSCSTNLVLQLCRVK